MTPSKPLESGEKQVSLTDPDARDAEESSAVLSSGPQPTPFSVQAHGTRQMPGEGVENKT
jgi:hypothetical protein